MSFRNKGFHFTHRLIVFVFCCLFVSSCGQPDTISVAPQAYPYPIQTPTPTMHPLDATQAAIEQRIRDERATAAILATIYPVPPQSSPTADPNAVRRFPPTGISVDCDTMYDRGIDETNCWRSRSDTLLIFVVVGAEPNNAAQGKLELYTAHMQSDEVSPYLTYPTPTQHGALTITEVAFPIITTQAADGTFFQFNYDTRQWLPPAPTP